jgi:hypothetical protein
MTFPPKPDVLTTSEALYQEFLNNKWAERLWQCRGERIDTATEYDEGEGEYQKRTLSRHYEGGVHIAFTIERLYRDGSSRMFVKMLYLDGARHISP